MIVYNSFHIGKSQTMPFNVVYVSGVLPVKLLKNLFLRHLRHSQPLVFYLDQDKILYILGIYIYNGLIGRIFDGIVKYINQNVCEMYVIQQCCCTRRMKMSC